MAAQKRRRGGKRKRGAGNATSSKMAKIRSDAEVNDSGDDATSFKRTRDHTDRAKRCMARAVSDGAPGEHAADAADSPDPPAAAPPVPPPPTHAPVGPPLKLEAVHALPFGTSARKAMRKNKAVNPSKEYVKRATSAAGIQRRSRHVYPHISKALAMQIDDLLRTAVILADHGFADTHNKRTCKVDASHVDAALKRQGIAIVGGDGVAQKSIQASLVKNRFNQLDLVRYRERREYRLSKRAVKLVQVAAETYFRRFNVHQKMNMKYVARRSTTMERDVVAAGVAATGLYQLAENLFAPENEYRAETFERAAKNVQAAKNKAAGGDARGRQTTFGRHEMLGVHYCCFDPTCTEGCVEDNAATRLLMAGAYDRRQVVKFGSMEGKICTANKQRLTALVSFPSLPDATFAYDAEHTPPADLAAWTKTMTPLALAQPAAPSADFAKTLMAASNCNDEGVCNKVVVNLVARRKLVRRRGVTQAAVHFKHNKAVWLWAQGKIAAGIGTRSALEAAATNTDTTRRATLVSELGALTDAHTRHLMDMDVGDIEEHVAFLRAKADLILKEPASIDFAAELNGIIASGHVVEHACGTLTLLHTPLSSLVPAGDSPRRPPSWQISAVKRKPGMRTAVHIAAKSLIESDSRRRLACRVRGTVLEQLDFDLPPDNEHEIVGLAKRSKNELADAQRRNNLLMLAARGESYNKQWQEDIDFLVKSGVVCVADVGTLNPEKWRVVPRMVPGPNREAGILREHLDDVTADADGKSGCEHAGFVEDPSYDLPSSEDDSEADSEADGEDDSDKEDDTDVETTTTSPQSDDAAASAPTDIFKCISAATTTTLPQASDEQLDELVTGIGDLPNFDDSNPASPVDVDGGGQMATGDFFLGECGSIAGKPPELALP